MGIVLPSLVSNEMVFQRNTTVRVWGWYNGNSKTIFLGTDWQDSELVSEIVDGMWEFSLEIPDADHKEHSIWIHTEDDSKELKRILFGEVWFAGGQSNMEMKMKGYWRAPVENSNIEIAESVNYPEIRCFTVERNASKQEQSFFSGKWESSSPDNVVNWSATGWFFAKHLYKTLNIPIGVIVSSWGGSMIEAWMSKEDLKDFSDVDYSTLDQFDGTIQTVSMSSPYLMYYGMIKPVSKYTIKGIIFYQGESNVGRHATYTSKMQKLIHRWREDFQLGNIPFYYVEITPYIYDPRLLGMGLYGALMREAQFKVQLLEDNCQMICTNDLVGEFEKVSIHPGRKEPIGERLAWCALNRDYGFKEICCTYPYLKDVKFIENKVHVSFVNSPGSPKSWTEFTNATGGKSDPRVMYYLLSQLSQITGFEVSGMDRIFYPAKIVGLGDDPSSFIVSCDKVQTPQALRYCFHDYCVGNLYNQREMPTIPFRTDNW